MDSKYVIFFSAVAFLLPAAIAAATQFPRLRDLAFFLAIIASIFADQYNINFIGQKLYRGSSRGVEVSIIDLMALIVLLSVIFAPGGPPRKISQLGSFRLLLAFLVYCIFSVLLASPHIFGVFELAKITRGILVFMAAAVYIRGERELRVFTVALACAVLYLGGVAVYQRYFLGMMRVEGTLKHSNNLSMYCCTAAPILIAMAMSNMRAPYRMIAALAAIAAGGATVLTVSRTGVVAYLIVSFGAFLSCLTGRFGPKQLGAIALVGVVSIAAAYKSWDNVMKRIGNKSFEEEFITSEKGRGMYFRLGALVIKDHFFGVGLNNWSYTITEEYYPVIGLESTPYPEDIKNLSTIMEESYSSKEKKHEIAPPAHNLGVLVMGELGVPGFVLFWAIWARWYQMTLPFWRRRNDTVLSRYGIGVFWALTGCFLTNLTEAGFKQTGVLTLMHVSVGILAALYQVRKAQASAIRFRRLRPALPEPRIQSALPAPQRPRRIPAVYR